MKVAPISPAVQAEYRRYASARLFGRFIQGARLARGRSIADLAPLACMEPSDWEALEEGQWFPDTITHMQLILDALAMPWDAMAEMLLLCDPVWNTPGSLQYS